MPPAASLKLPRVHPIWLPIRPEAFKQPAFSGRAQAKTVVIGAGIAGVMTAWRLAEAGQRAVLLDEGQVLNGDTGYTTAFVTRVVDTSLKNAAGRVGLEKLKLVWQRARAAQDWLRDIVQREKIDCDWVDCNSYIVSYHANDQKLRDEFSVMRQLDSDAAWVTPTDDPNLPRGVVAAIRIPNEARMHIRKFIFGLLSRPVAKHIQRYENTKVSRVALQGKKVLIETADGQLEAEQAFVTTGYPSLLPELGKKITSDITYVVAAEYPDKLPISNHIFWDTEEPYQYYRPFNERTLILGGADRQAGQAEDPDTPHSELIAFLDNHFPGYEKISHRWSGSIHAAPDGLPVMGWMPGTKQVGVVTGIFGSGMVYGTLGGMLLGDLALGKQTEAEEIFSPKRFGIPALQPSSQSASVKPQSGKLTLLQWLLPLVPLGAISYAVYTFFSPRGLDLVDGLDFRTSTLILFPLFGLLAFTFLWIQLMIGSLMPLLRKVYRRIERFHRIEGVFVLLFATLHPLWLTIGYGLETVIKRDYVSPEKKIYIYFAYTALSLMYLTVTTALLSRWQKLQSWWRKIHLLNYVVFYVALIHSWNLGSDVQTTGLRILWWGYGIAVTAALGYRIFFRRDPAAITPKIASTDTFVKVATLDQVQPDKPFCAVVNGKQIALFNINGQVYALDNVCNHADGPLCEGFVDGETIECPLHASRFHIKTGALIEGPATQPQPTFKVRMNGNDIEVMA